MTTMAFNLMFDVGGLKPGETKSFRLPFDDLPASWNQAMPQLVIAGVKFS